MKEYAEEQGLMFSCTMCGSCCGGAPGYVWLGLSDIAGLSLFLKIKPMALIDTYCRKFHTLEGFSLSLKEKKSTYDCIFLEQGRCSVYSARPIQCRTYPFWEEVLASSDSWNQEKRFCPGIGKGNLVSLEEIQNRVHLRRSERMHIFTQEELENLER
jgi:hypothetical protein